MMSMNPDPRLTQHLAHIKAFSSNKLAVVDVGARFGAQEHWSAYDDNQISMIGFEPDEKECEELNKQQAGKGSRRYFPVALNSYKGKRTFYVYAFSSSSSFYRPNNALVSRFPDIANLAVEKTIEINTVDLDSFAKEHDIKYVDFMKLDVEGAELDVLKGAESLLKSSVLGLQVEFLFSQWREEQPVFSDMDSYLRSHGFSLFDITINRHARSALREPLYGKPPEPTKNGQCIWGDALYLLDGVSEIEAGRNAKIRDDISVLKLASLMEIYNLRDCSIELLQSAGKKGFLKNLNVDHMLDLLVPAAGSYQQYLDMIKRKDKEKPPSSSIRKLARMTPAPVRNLGKKILIRFRDAMNSLVR
ncbi:FkbM family methyltransferase [Elusimicrobiota bacterium]